MARKKTTPKDRLAAAKTRLDYQTTLAELDNIKLKRKAIKAQSAMLSTYGAARRNRTNRDWLAQNVSADTGAIGDGPTMHARARQMVRDDDYAASIVRAFKRNVVGTGITPAWTSPHKPFNADAVKAFKRWAKNPKLVDRERRRDFCQIQSWAIGEVITVGEAIVVMSFEQRDKHVGLVLQCVEAEQLDHTKLAHEGNEIRGGVEVDEYGAAVAYWLYQRHPNDIVSGGVIPNRWHRPEIRQSGQYDTRDRNDRGTLGYSHESIRVEADRVLHIFDPERVRQTRGVTRLASCMQRLRDLGTFDAAQLIAAKAEACIGLIIKQTLGMNGNGLPAPGSSGTDSDGNDELALQPLMVARLDPGEDVAGFTPTRPGNMYDGFVTKQLRGAAAGVGLSYEQVGRDFTGGTYSSQRQSMLEDRREFEPLQNLIACHLCQPVAEQFVQWAVLGGQLIANGYEIDAEPFHEINWQGQGWEWIDPQKQAVGIGKMMELKLTTQEIEANKLGHDWRELQKQRELETAGPVATTPTPDPPTPARDEQMELFKPDPAPAPQQPAEATV